MQIPEHQLELWNAYQEYERQKVRSKSLPALDRFVASLLELPPTDWHSWALNLAQRVVDCGDDITIRFPLFYSILFPALRGALAGSRPGASRWLAGFSQFLYQSPACFDQLPENQRTEIGLLRAALVHEPNDQLARSRLIPALARQLENAIHEVPSGVLWGQNGANVGQCAELRAELDEFCRLAVTERVTRQYQELIDACQLHFNAYPHYLANHQRTSSYAEYLWKFHDA